MFKFLCLSFLVIFGGVGAFLLFADPGIPERKADAPFDGKITEGAPVPKDYDMVSALAQRVAGDCFGRDAECSAFRIYDYVRGNFKLEEAAVGEERPAADVILNRKGDKLALAGLTSSLLEDVGIKAVTRSEGGLTASYACGINVPRFYGLIKNYMRSKILAKREITLDKKGVWAVDIRSRDGKPFTVDFSAAGAKNFDVALFQSQEDMKLYLAGGTGKYFENCVMFDVPKAELSCVAPNGSKLAFISRDDGNLFRGEVFRGGFLMSDMNMQDIDGETCVAMDMEY